MNVLASSNFATAANAFDRVAETYDDIFTHSAIGQAQRGQVWRRLLAAFAPGERILEMNCGTGEDARFLGSQGRRVIACDASSGMIEVAAARTQQLSVKSQVAFHQLANEDLGDLPQQALFDGAFSNFSGLNCVVDLRSVANNLASLVKPGGKVLICLWNRVCPPEIVWYLVRGRASKAFRRFSRHATARIGERSISVFYPTAHDVQKAFAPSFMLERREAIGLFVPPSYFEGWAANHRGTLKRLDGLDRMFAGRPVLRNLGDHVLLEFTRCTL
jgi:ubiquinone/menaquinone biosynthesis C-methylase UbiE